MDELTATLAGSFSVSCTPNNTASQHPRWCQYKVKHNVPDQQERRRRMLDAQKQRRFDYVNHARHLAEGEFTVSEGDEELDEMDWAAGPKKPPRHYKDQLMYSEWLVEVPDDLEQEWNFMLCPEGKRNLIVASKGSTKAYTKGGYLIQSFPSHLPGGSRSRAGHKYKYTILDCIYNEILKTYYILDIMCWENHPVFECETEFRFYWLQTKLKENERSISEASNINPYKFIPLPFHSCTKENIAQVVNGPLPFPVPLDGILFYHKRTHYTHGPTPLVGWLKGFMLPEMLGIDVPIQFMKQMPQNYINMRAQLKETFEKVDKLKQNEKEELSSSEMMEEVPTESTD